MTDTLSLFGFDLFGLSRRPPGKPDEQAENRAVAREPVDERAPADQEKEYEAFLWGMYPIY
jgi:hypothetical protein